MRYALATLLLLSSAAPVLAQPAPAAPPAAAAAQQYDVPSKPSYVAILTRDFAPGQAAGRHIHHGVEMAIVIRGELEIIADGQPNHIYHTGESFIIPREVPHDARNSGTTATTIAVTYVNDKDTPLRISVPDKK